VKAQSLSRSKSARDIQDRRNLPKSAAEFLRSHGFDAETVREESLSGAADDVIAATIQRENRVLITLDLDFSDIRTYPPEHYSGIVVLRPKAQDKIAIMARLRRLLKALENNRPEHALWIVESDRIRYRRSR
jgi:predicted nuclease of predicted toxin-antitoxin system